MWWPRIERAKLKSWPASAINNKASVWFWLNQSGAHQTPSYFWCIWRLLIYYQYVCFVLNHHYRRHAAKWRSIWSCWRWSDRAVWGWRNSRSPRPSGHRGTGTHPASTTCHNDPVTPMNTNTNYKWIEMDEERERGEGGKSRGREDNRAAL